MSRVASAVTTRSRTAGVTGPPRSAGPSAKLDTGTTATRAKARRHSRLASAKSGVTLEMFSEDVVKGDEEDGEFVPGGPTAGAKRASDGGAAATAKLAMSTTAARMNACAKDRTNARQDNPAETGGNPKAPPKSGFPFAAFIENVRSGDEGKGDFVLEGPAAAAKGARVRNTSATTSRSQRRRPKPMKKRAHAEALPILLARRSIEGMVDYAPPGSTSNRQADNPQVPGAPFAALFAQTHEETGPRGSAAQFLGRHSIRGRT